MGCGCNKKNSSGAVAAVNTRTTVYQVLDPNRQVVGEHSTLQEARADAQAKGGIVRVASKQK